MSINEKPFPELISTEEQKTSVQKTDINIEETLSTEKGSKKTLKVIALILLILIIGVGCYYIYDRYIKKVDNDEVEVEDDESTLQYRDVFIDQENGKVLHIKLPISQCEDVEYRIVNQENPNVLAWEENSDENCKLAYGLAYFKDEQSMTEYYSSEVKYPLEKVVIDDVEYEIVFENGTYVQAGLSGSILYQRQPTITVGGYEAFRTIFVYGILPNLTSRISNPETIMATYCVFDLSKLGKDVSGYLVFNGSDPGTNYCDILNDSDNFELSIEQLGLL